MMRPILVLALVVISVAGARASYNTECEHGAHLAADPTMAEGLPHLSVLDRSTNVLNLLKGVNEDSDDGDILEQSIIKAMRYVVSLLDDPMELVDEDIQCCNNADVASLSGIVTSVTLSGISNLQVDKLKLYLASQQAVVNVSIPEFSMEADIYIQNGSTISPLNISFSGGFNASIKANSTVSLSLTCALAVTDDMLQIDSIDTTPDFGAVVVQIGHTGDGFFTDNLHLDEVINKVEAHLQRRIFKNVVPFGVALGVQEVNKLLVKLQSPLDE